MKRYAPLVLLLVAYAAAWLMPGGSAWCQQEVTGRGQPSLEELERRLEEQRRRLEDLEKQLSSESPEPEQGSQDGGSVPRDESGGAASGDEAKDQNDGQAGGENGGGEAAGNGDEAPQPTISEVEGESLTAELAGRIHWDTTYGTDDGLAETFLGSSFENGHEFRRVRLGVEGQGYGLFKYEVDMEFSEFNNPQARDVYIGGELPIGHFQIGHMKEPFTIEQLMSSNNLTFLERALPESLVTQRSLGLMLYDQWGEDDRGTWAIGTFWDEFQQEPAEDDGDVDNADEEFRRVTVRLTRLIYWDPFAEDRYLVHLGGSMRHTEVDPAGDTVFQFQARPEVHDTFQFLGVVPAPTDTYQLYNAEAAGQWGPLSIRGQYIAASLQNEANSMLHGGYVQAGYFLTGEHRSYDKEWGIFDDLEPLENFWWVESADPYCRYGRGAWEVAARWSWLDYDDGGLTAIGGTDGTRGELHAATLAVNWYWNPQMRWMFDYVYTELDDAVTGRDADVHAFLTRFQLSF